MKAGRKQIHLAETMMDAALHIAARDGYRNMRREDIADRAGCSAGLISKYFGTMPQLRRTVMRAAVTRGVHSVIAQGLAAGDPNAHAASPAVKRHALEGLL